MRNVHLIAYDIADPKRLRKVHKTMKGHGDSLQYSVFRCELSPVELHQLKEILWPILNFAEDRIMLVDLGPTGGRGDNCIEFWGQPHTKPNPRTSIII